MEPHCMYCYIQLQAVISLVVFQGSYIQGAILPNKQYNDINLPGMTMTILFILMIIMNNNLLIFYILNNVCSIVTFCFPDGYDFPPGITPDWFRYNGRYIGQNLHSHH